MEMKSYVIPDIELNSHTKLSANKLVGVSCRLYTAKIIIKHNTNFFKKYKIN